MSFSAACERAHWREKGSLMSLRPVKQIIQTTPTIEGAGVKLQRAFGFGKTRDFDPFLLLDDFRNENPRDYLAGFPWHPHRGIETITYVLAGSVEHGDSLGNHGRMTGGGRRARLPPRGGPALSAEAAPGRDHAQCVRLRLRRLRHVPRRLGSAERPDRVSHGSQCSRQVRGGQSLAGALRPRRRGRGTG